MGSTVVILVNPCAWGFQKKRAQSPHMCTMLLALSLKKVEDQVCGQRRFFKCSAFICAFACPPGGFLRKSLRHQGGNPQITCPCLPSTLLFPAGAPPQDKHKTQGSARESWGLFLKAFWQENFRNKNARIIPLFELGLAPQKKRTIRNFAACFVGGFSMPRLPGGNRKANACAAQ